jgi:hypothetical protein
MSDGSRRTALLNGYPVTPEYLARFEESQQVPTYLIAGSEFPRIRYGSESADWGFDSDRQCHDCRAVVGQYHAIGCDVEQCPRCGEQAISCDCEDEEEDED